MTEYFIQARSFAAPFVSDESSQFVKANSPQSALEKFADSYRHPAGLFAAECYESADAYHKGKKFLAQWLSNHAREYQRLTKDACSYLGHGPGDFEVNGVRHKIAKAKQGAVV